MTVEYQKVWRTMNDLEMVTSKICSAREIIDNAVDKIQGNEYDKAELLMNAAYEFLEYYLQEFDDKFKLAWQATVGDLRDGDVKENNKSWDSFFDIGHDHVFDHKYTDEELNAMCDKAELDNKHFQEPFTTDIGTVSQNGVTFQEYRKAQFIVNYSGSIDSEKEHYQKIVDKYEGKKMSHSEWHRTEWEKGRNEKLLLTHDEAIAAGWEMTDDGIWMPPKDKKKWVLPVEQVHDDYFVSFPDDLLQAAKLKEGDVVEWVDNGDGTYTIRHKTMSNTLKKDALTELKDSYAEEMLAAGYKMIDGRWQHPELRSDEC